MTTAAWLLVICTIICLCGSVVAVPTLEKFAPPVSGGQSGGLEPIVKGPANVQGASPLGAPIVGAVKQKPQVTANGPSVQIGSVQNYYPKAGSGLMSCMSVTFYGSFTADDYWDIRAIGVSDAQGTPVVPTDVGDGALVTGIIGWNAGLIERSSNTLTAYFDFTQSPRVFAGAGTATPGNPSLPAPNYVDRDGADNRNFPTSAQSFAAGLGPLMTAASFSQLRFDFWKAGNVINYGDDAINFPDQAGAWDRPYTFANTNEQNRRYWDSVGWVTRANLEAGMGTGMSSCVVTVPYKSSVLSNPNNPYEGGYFKLFNGPYIDWLSFGTTNTIQNQGDTARSNVALNVGGSGFRPNAMVFLLGPDSTSLAMACSRNVTATTITARAGSLGTNLTTAMNMSYFYGRWTNTLDGDPPTFNSLNAYPLLKVSGRPDGLDVNPTAEDRVNNLWLPYQYLDFNGLTANTQGYARWVHRTTSNVDPTPENRIVQNPAAPGTSGTTGTSMIPVVPYIDNLPFLPGTYYVAVWNPAVAADADVYHPNFNTAKAAGTETRAGLLQTGDLWTPIPTAQLVRNARTWTVGLQNFGQRWSFNTAFNLSAQTGATDLNPSGTNLNMRLTLTAPPTITGYNGVTAGALPTGRNSTIGGTTVSWRGTGLLANSSAYLIQDVRDTRNNWALLPGALPNGADVPFTTVPTVIKNLTPITVSADGTTATTTFDLYNKMQGFYYLKQEFPTLDNTFVTFGNRNQYRGPVQQYYRIVQGPHIRTSTPVSVSKGTNPFYMTVTGSGFVGAYNNDPATRSFCLTLTRVGTTEVKYPTAVGGVTINGFTSSVTPIFDTRDWTPGVYKLAITSSGTLPTGFNLADGNLLAPESDTFFVTVTDGSIEPPAVYAISPDLVSNLTPANSANGVSVTLLGSQFREGARVNLTRPATGETIWNASPTVFAGSNLTVMTTTFNRSLMTLGAGYNVYVTNLDGMVSQEQILFRYLPEMTMRYNSPTKVKKGTHYTMKITGTYLTVGSIITIEDANAAHSNRNQGPWTLTQVNKLGTFIKTDESSFVPASAWNSGVYNITVTRPDGSTKTRAWGLSVTK